MNVGRVANTVNKKLTYLLGVCVPSPKQNAAKVRVQRLEFDSHIYKYFKYYDFIYAADPENLCKTGDTVLIQSLPQKLTRIITHKVVDVVYPLGDITDPITGKKVIAGRYRDTVQEDAELFGILPSAYKFTEPAKRGRMENIRDFTSKETYVKHNADSDNNDPYAIDPV